MFTPMSFIVIRSAVIAAAVAAVAVDRRYTKTVAKTYDSSSRSCICSNGTDQAEGILCC